MTGSSSRVSGCTSMPLVPSKPECALDLENLTESPSSCLRSTGDQPPATLPAMIPAIAAAGPNAELECDRRDRCDRVRLLGDVFVNSVGGASPSGVCGRSLFDRDRDCDSLRDRGRNVSTGCCILYAKFDMRPPRTLLRKVSSSRIPSYTGFQGRMLSSSSSTVKAGLFLVR
jgi:hypothetical protein